MSALTPVNRDDPDSGSVAPSFSGNERNRLFLGRDGNFSEVTLVSGVDFRQDGRGFAIVDFDKDGYLDLAITSPTEPRLKLMRNCLGDNPDAPTGNYLNVSLTGGNSEAKSNVDLSSANACAAIIRVVVDGKTRVWQETCGEGLSTQNSKWIHVGMGESQQIDTLEVTWPSGKSTVRENLKAGEWIRIFEGQ